MTSRRPTDKTILRILIGGFALVMTLLIVAGVVGVRSARAIQSNVAHLVKEQLLTARLINEMQLEQSTLSAVFYKLTRAPELIDWDSLTEQLEETDEEFDRIVTEADGTPEEDSWRELQVAARAFSNEAARIISQRRTSPASMTKLFAMNDLVIRRVAKLVAAGSARTLAAESRIEAQSKKAVNDSLLLLGSCLAFGTLCALLTVRMATASFRKMEWQASELSRVSFHMLEGQEATARRFSHELHDELGQSLAAVRANLTTLTPDTLKSKQADCVQLVDGAISNVRELSQLLRPVILDDFGLDAALRWLAEKFTQRTRIKVEYQSGFSGRLADGAETHLFRIAQEALTNVARHSGASVVSIELAGEGEQIRLRIADNGRGLPAEADPHKMRDESQAGGMGLVGMRARARYAGGELALRPANGGGLAVEIWVPLTKMHNDAKQEDAHPSRG